MLHPYPHEVDQTRPIVEFIDVSCGYNETTVLSDLNLRIHAGDFVGLVGPSGAGKTTLLRAILGGVNIYSGRVLLDGKPVGETTTRAGYVPQLEAIDWNFPVTVEQVVLMGRASDGWGPWNKRQAREQAYSVMDRLGIANLAGRHIRALSGGQQQRVFLGRALVSNPRLLLLDEPTAGVDIKTRDDVLHLLDELNHEGVTVIMSTHELNAVAAHLPWVVCVNGRIIAEGSPAEVYTPANLQRTYGAEMAVFHHEGMTFVAESPHRIGRHRHPHPAGAGGKEAT
jgi:zinc/manganese transport system ATP-binding protein/zinc transport system ATP-binding protein